MCICTLLAAIKRDKASYASEKSSLSSFDLLSIPRESQSPFRPPFVNNMSSIFFLLALFSSGLFLPAEGEVLEAISRRVRPGMEEEHMEATINFLAFMRSLDDLVVVIEPRFNDP